MNHPLAEDAESLERSQKQVLSVELLRVPMRLRGRRISAAQLNPQNIINIKIRPNVLVPRRESFHNLLSLNAFRCTLTPQRIPS